MSGLTRILAFLLLMFGSSLPPEQITSTRAGKPDLVVSHVGPTPRQAAAGGALRLSPHVANRGAGRAERSTIHYFLSRSTEKDPGDLRLVGRTRVPALGPGVQLERPAHLTVPAAVPSGAYYVVACAEAARRISERREANNCRLSAQRVAIR